MEPRRQSLEGRAGYHADYVTDPDQDYQDEDDGNNDETTHDDDEPGEMSIAEEYVGYFVEDGLDFDDNDDAEQCRSSRRPL